MPRKRKPKPKPIRLTPPPDAIDAVRVPSGWCGYGMGFSPAAQRLYRIRDLLIDGHDTPVRVIGSVGPTGKLRDLNRLPVRVFDPPDGKDGAA